MTRQRHSIDGFVPRRSGAQIGGQRPEEPVPKVGPVPATLRELHTAGTTSHQPAKRTGISRSEIDESLKGINPSDNDKKGKKRKTPEQKAKRRKIIKRVALLIIIILISVFGYLGVKALMAGGNVFKGNPLDVFMSVPLKQDANGRSNILVLGTSEDDPGHQGSDLTDSMMIVSIDQNKKNAYMISIPRDMEVKYGRACAAGYQGKVNAYFTCIKEGEGVDADRAALAEESKFIGGVFGMDIQYGVNVNYTVMRDLVNAVGGTITVNIESRDPKGQMDSNFDWKCGVGDRKVSRAEVLRRCPSRGHFIDYPNGPAVLDAEHALYLAQARGDSAPTYGFEQSNFDREKNQQKIIKALREKAVSAGTLTDFGKVSNIVDALGNNLRTTFETKEFQTLVNLAKDIKSEEIKTISLIDGDTPVMNGDGNPAAGKFQYDAIRLLIQQSLSSDPVVREKASIAVLNGSGMAGVAQTQADKLTEQNFNVQTIANAPEGDYGTAKIYQIGTGNTATAAKLKKIYGVEVLTTESPVAVAPGIDFVVIVGKAPSTGTSAQ